MGYGSARYTLLFALCPTKPGLGYYSTKSYRVAVCIFCIEGQRDGRPFSSTRM